MPLVAADQNPSLAAPTLRVYFPNLNALRFLAAIMVIFHHLERMARRYDLPPVPGRHILDAFGPLGVTLFFVLSGFLITYLLLVEVNGTGTVRIGEFYLRRVLRIWPLYYLIVGLSLFVFPHLDFFHQIGYPPASDTLDNIWVKILLFVLLLPNMLLGRFPIVPYAAQTWSIGTEEQFYLVWPWLVRRFHSKLLLVLGIVIGGYLLLDLALLPFPLGTVPCTVRNLMHLVPIHYMAIGGVFATLVYQQSPLLERFVFRAPVQVAAWGLLIVLFAVTGEPNVGLRVVYAVLFGVVVVNMAANPARLFSLEYAPLDYLGKISYGLYMYHAIGMLLAVRTLEALGMATSIVGLTVLTLPYSIVLSGLSYTYLEKPFIRLKARFSPVVSGENAR